MHWFINFFRFIWDRIMAIVFLYLFFMIPWTMSFYRLPKKESVANETLDLLTPAYILCLVDILINCITGYISKDGREIFIDPLLILSNYTRGFLTIDLVSSVPYIWIYEKRVEAPGLDVNFLLLFLEILPLLKFFRLCTLRHYIQEIDKARGVSRVYDHGIWIFFFTILIFHWAACFTYAFPIFYAYIERAPMKEARGFLFNTKLYEEPTLYIYLTSLHMGGGNLCGYSYTEFKYTDFPDKITRCILLVFGMVYFLYVIGDYLIVLQLVSSSSEPELKYHSIMHGVNDYSRSKKLPKELKERLLQFYERRFQGSLFKEKAIMHTLSKHLKNEITQHSSRILLESTPLFTNISRNLLNNIIGSLKQMIYLQDDIIYYCGSRGKYMYFIISGTVALISYFGNEICHVKDGEHFGEIALFEHGHKRMMSAIALEVCEVLRFDRRDFTRLVPLKSEFYNRLESAARERLRDVAFVNGRNSVEKIFGNYANQTANDDNLEDDFNAEGTEDENLVSEDEWLNDLDRQANDFQG